MDHQDGWEDGDGGAEAVERAFREVADAVREQREDAAARIAALDRSVAEATAALAELVRTEYAGELARLAGHTGELAQRLEGLGKTARDQREAISGLFGAAARAERLWDRMGPLVSQLDGIVARPAEVETQRRAVWHAAAAGALAGLVLFVLGLWALPDRLETAAARAVMGASYWDAAWRMMDAYDPEWRRTMVVLTWIDVTPEEAERHRACLDRARETGQPQQCTVTFRPK